MRIVTILGARPQFIKAAAVSRVAASTPGVEELLLHTGQHYDENMSDVFFQEMGIPRPAYQLGMGTGTHGAMTGRMLGGIEEVLLELKPHWVLIYGDTNSTLAGALAAAKLHIPVAHVEAGLRSFNRRMPEETNRVLSDHASDLLFAPTATAVRNLANEGLAGDKVRLVGDVMYDAALYFGEQAERGSPVLREQGLASGRYVLATVHRAENTDDPARLAAIFRGLMAIARAIPVVLPLHPRTRQALTRAGLLEEVERRLRVLPPVGYLDMVMLEKHARLVATDSGGVQKEAFFYRVPCLTLRDETEWVELVELGWNTLCPPTSAAAIAEAAATALARRPREASSPYGDGRSAELILETLKECS